MRSPCRLLADEVAAAVIPTRSLLAPAGSAWLPLGMPVTRFCSKAGTPDWPRLRAALRRLVDLTDQVAQALRKPFADISMEMVYRSLYYFTQAYHRGDATDVVAYLVQHAKLFGIIKRKRSKSRASPLQSPPLTNPGGP